MSEPESEPTEQRLYREAQAYQITLAGALRERGFEEAAQVVESIAPAISGPVSAADIEWAKNAGPQKLFEEANITAARHQATQDHVEYITKLANNPQQIRLHAGELTEAEMRAVVAILKLVAFKLKDAERSEALGEMARLGQEYDADGGGDD